MRRVVSPCPGSGCSCACAVGMPCSCAAFIVASCCLRCSSCAAFCAIIRRISSPSGWPGMSSTVNIRALHQSTSPPCTLTRSVAQHSTTGGFEVSSAPPLSARPLLSHATKCRKQASKQASKQGAGWLGPHQQKLLPILEGAPPVERVVVLPPAVRPEVIERALIVRFMRRQIHSDVPEPVLPPDTRTRNVQCVLHHLHNLQFRLALACRSCSAVRCQCYMSMYATRYLLDPEDGNIRDPD